MTPSNGYPHNDWDGYVKLRDTLRYIRQKQGLSQQNLASLLGCSKSTIAHVELSLKRPSIGFVHKWAAACGCEAVLDIKRKI